METNFSTDTDSPPDCWGYHCTASGTCPPPFPYCEKRRINAFEPINSEKLFGVVHILVEGGTSSHAPSDELLRILRSTEAANLGNDCIGFAARLVGYAFSPFHSENYKRSRNNRLQSAVAKLSVM